MVSRNKQLTQDLRAYLLQQGADLVGFGSVNRIEGAPEIMRPQRYLPDAVSMISIGLLYFLLSCHNRLRRYPWCRYAGHIHQYQDVPVFQNPERQDGHTGHVT